MKRRKIYYVPGMISLICLPILCILYLNEHKNELRSLEVYYANKYDPNNKDIIRFDTTALSEPGHKRKYEEFHINESSEDSKLKLKIELSAKQIVDNNDTTKGIHIIFGDNTNYQSYISIIDIFNKYNKFITTTDENKAYRNHKDLYSHLYLQFENQLWFHIYKYPQLKNEVWECQTNIIYIPFKETLQNKISNLIDKNKVIMKLWLFFFIFIAFSILSIYYIKSNYIKK